MLPEYWPILFIGGFICGGLVTMVNTWIYGRDKVFLHVAVQMLAFLISCCGMYYAGHVSHRFLLFYIVFIISSLGCSYEHQFIRKS